jgi:hypothetical protein
LIDFESISAPSSEHFGIHNRLRRIFENQRKPLYTHQTRRFGPSTLDPKLVPKQGGAPRVSLEHRQHKQKHENATIHTTQNNYRCPWLLHWFGVAEVLERPQ